MVMNGISRRRLLAGMGGFSLGFSGLAAHADEAAPPLRIGVLTDMSSLYADATGPGSVVAAKMAVEDFQAGPHKMRRSIEVLSGDHMNPLPMPSSVSGSTSCQIASRGCMTPLSQTNETGTQTSPNPPT